MKSKREIKIILSFLSLEDDGMRLVPDTKESHNQEGRFP